LAEGNKIFKNKDLGKQFLKIKGGKNFTSTYPFSFFYEIIKI
jgi:hypothetical protein